MNRGGFYSRRRLMAGIIACGLFGAGCGPRPTAATDAAARKPAHDEGPMAIDDDEFRNVPLNTNDENPCSPQVADRAWRGIVIRAPRRVTFKPGAARPFAVIPICGYKLLEVPAKPSQERIRLVAVNRATGATYSGEVVELDPSPQEPPPEAPPLSAKELKGLASGGYFNPNLTDFVELPETTATYLVHVEFQGAKSNVVTIAVVEEE
ncbi:MAG: hypothetical protein AMXMBFR83_00860 [Phycisphaerae bacterium]